MKINAIANFAEIKKMLKRLKSLIKTCTAQ